MALNPSGAISLAGPVAGQSIAVELGQSATATISLNDTNVRTLAQKPSGVIVMPTDFWGKSNITGTQRAIFGFGTVPGPNRVSITNLVSSSGVMASDTPGVGTPRSQLGAASYGGDKAIFGFGTTGPATGDRVTTINLVSNTGVVASDTPGAGTARRDISAAGYGGDKVIFMGGVPTGASPATTLNANLVSNTGAVASDTIYPAINNRFSCAGLTYGGDKGMLAFGNLQVGSARTNITNLISNTGVIAADTPGVGTARFGLAAASYGGDKAICGFGSNPGVGPVLNMTNLVSNTGVVAADTPGVGTARFVLAAAGYGGDKAIFGFGFTPTVTNITNLVSNTGVVASNTPGVGTARTQLAAAGYSTSA